MRKTINFFIIIVIFLAISNKSNAQDTIIEEDQITTMINHALLTVLKIEKMYAVNKVVSKEYWEKLHVWVDHYPSGFEPSKEIADMGLKYISIHSLSKKQKKKGVNGVAFSGVIIVGNKIMLNFGDMGVHLRNDTLHIGRSSDGYSFEYEYSCEKQDWVLIKMPKQYDKLKHNFDE